MVPFLVWLWLVSFSLARLWSLSQNNSPTKSFDSFAGLLLTNAAVMFVSNPPCPFQQTTTSSVSFPSGRMNGFGIQGAGPGETATGGRQSAPKFDPLDSCCCLLSDTFCLDRAPLSPGPRPYASFLIFFGYPLYSFSFVSLTLLLGT